MVKTRERSERLMKVISWALISVAVVSASLMGQSIPLINYPLVPVSAKPGGKRFALIVNGTGFAKGAVVEWNGQERVTEFVSDRQVKAIINAADIAKPSTASISVVNANGATSNFVMFPVRASSPTVAMTVQQVFEDCTAVAVADFNSDGLMDVAWAGPRTLNVSLGDGKGGFGPPIPTSQGYLGGYQLIAADFNGDGKPDIAVENNGVTIYLGNGDGTFRLAWSWIGENIDSFISTADFNQDGRLDLYVTGWDLGQQWFEIFLGNGDGTFSLDQTYYTSGFANYAGLPAVGDFNGDGELDLGVAQSFFSQNQLYLGNGHGSFDPSTVFVGGTRSLGAADMNHDGKLDMVDDSGCILLGNGDGTFHQGGCATGSGIVIGFGDFNGDGRLDVAFLSPGPPRAAIIGLGNGDGTFRSTVSFTVGSEDSPLLGGIGDFNGDGKLDIISGNGVLLLQANPPALKPN